MRPLRLPPGLRALRHRNFQLFWSGQLISLTGTWIESVAQGWLILLITRDPLALGIRAAAQFVPTMVLGLFAGVVADAVPKRRALMVTQSLAGIVALAMAVLAFGGNVQPWQVYLLAFLFGIVSAFDMPIRQSFTVEMVGREDLTSAVALNSSVFNATRIIGPAVAGILISIASLPVCFLINALSYLAVIGGLLFMDESKLQHPPRVHLERSARVVLTQLAEGLRYIRQTRALLLAISVIGIVSTVAFNFQVVLPLLAVDVLHGDATVYGFLNSAAGVGSLIGALVYAVTGRAPTFRRLLIGSTTVGVTMIALGWSSSLPVSLVLLAVTGWGLITMAVTANMLTQLISPDRLRGRTMSVYTTVIVGSTPIGGLASGAVAASFGTPAVFYLAGSITLVTAGLAYLLSPGERALGRYLADPEALGRAVAQAASPPAAAAAGDPHPLV